jgi:hypothetical protein
LYFEVCTVASKFLTVISSYFYFVNIVVKFYMQSECIAWLIIFCEKLSFLFVNWEKNPDLNSNAQCTGTKYLNYVQEQNLKFKFDDVNLVFGSHFLKLSI